MKSIIFFLIPLFALAQNPYPDTVVMINGKEYPCLITEINESRIEILYSNNVSESSILLAVSKIVLENHGTVYTSDTGFNTEIDYLAAVIKARNDRLETERIIEEEQVRLEASAKIKPNTNTEKPVQIEKIRIKKKDLDINQWSFGALLIPYFSGKTYLVIYNNYYNQQYVDVVYSAKSEINMESQIAFGVSPNLKLTLDLAYQSSYYERKYEYFRETDNPESLFDYGNITKNGLKLLDITIGAKYYIGDMSDGNVSVYFLAGFGKQLAWATSETEVLFEEPDPEVINENNEEEFLEDINSPFHLNFGFGAEYFFNKSLSLNTNIRFLYSSFSGKLETRQIRPNDRTTTIVDQKESELITRVGIGLNFYF